MQANCDVYLSDNVAGSNTCLQLLPKLIEGVAISSDTQYQGFLGLKINRIKAVSLVILFRKQNIRAFSAPIHYRENAALPYGQAMEVAAASIDKSEFSLGDHLINADFPVYWAFPLTRISAKNAYEISGNRYVYVDKIDGRLWSLAEVEEYNYDYNNII